MSRFHTIEDVSMRILLRWAINSFGLWLSAELISSVSFEGKTAVILWSGLLLSLINAAIKPLVVMLSLPAILLSLGIFIFLINGLMVYLVGLIIDDFVVETFGSAVLAGLIVGLVNYSMTTLLEKE